MISPNRATFAALLIAFGITLTTGCATISINATNTPIEPVRQERVFPTDYEHTWKAIMKAMIELNMPIIKESKTDGFIITDSIPIKKNVFDEQVLFEDFNERVETGKYKVQVTLSPLENNMTKVKLIPSIEKYVKYIDVWKLQESNGVIEQTLFQTIFIQLLKDQKTIKTISQGKTKNLKSFAVTLEKLRIMNIGLAMDFTILNITNKPIEFPMDKWAKNSFKKAYLEDNLGNKYFVIGTTDVKQESKKITIGSNQSIPLVYYFGYPVKGTNYFTFNDGENEAVFEKIEWTIDKDTQNDPTPANNTSHSESPLPEKKAVTPLEPVKQEEKTAKTKKPVQDEASQPQPRVHIVKAKDTLGSIAKQYTGSANNWKKLMQYNNLKSQSLKLGQKINIPADDR